MKTKKSDFINKILFVVIAAILSGLLIAFMVGFYRDKRQELNNSTGKIKNVSSSVSNIDFEAYNGTTISGETLINLIKEVIKDNSELSIAVQTYANATTSPSVIVYYNRALDGTTKNITTATVSDLDEDQKRKSNASYITPTSNFYGELLRNPNDEITGILFVQKK
jgi:hypothetical protein